MVRIVALVLFTACDVGTVLVAQNTAPDGMIGSGSNCQALVSPAPTDNTHTAPVDPAKPTNAGQGCMTAAGCHNMALGLGVGAPEYSYAGTAYLDAQGTMPAAGATILVSMGGTTRMLIAGNTGNFQETPTLLAAPTATATGMTSASLCPSTTAMTSPIAVGQGNCNQGGTCHGAGGSQGPIHIP